MLIQTTKGMLEESTLQKVTKTEEIPCGWCDETEYFLDHDLVRRDVHVRVKEGLMGEAVAGSLSDAQRAPVKEFIAEQYKELLQSFSDEIGDKLRAAYPELSGMALSFNLPGFRLEIKPSAETEEGET